MELPSLSACTKSFSIGQSCFKMGLCCYTSVVEKIEMVWKCFKKFPYFVWNSFANTKERIYVVESLDAPHGKGKELGIELLKIASLSREESGCLFYDLYQDRQNDHRFTVIMCFRNQDAYDKHVTAPFIDSFAKKFDTTLYTNVVEHLYQRV